MDAKTAANIKTGKFIFKGKPALGYATDSAPQSIDRSEYAFNQLPCERIAFISDDATVHVDSFSRFLYQ